MKEEALKLADELDRIGCTDYCRIEEASPMIRRLVEELDKQGEPVAVIYQHPDDLKPAIRFTKPFAYKAMTVVNPDIPLYTTPQTKPLSDEEIEKTCVEVLPMLKLFLLVPEYEWIKRLCRAIEAKVRGQ